MSGIREAEKEIIKTVEQLGMLPLLTASNILRKESNGDIVYLNPGMESTLADIRFEPDETDAVTVDELLEFHSDFYVQVRKQAKNATLLPFPTLQHCLLNLRKRRGSG